MSEEKDSNKNLPEKNSRSNNNKHNTGKKKASETVVFYDKDSLSNESQTTSAAASRDNKPEKQHMKKINMDYSSKKVGKLPKYRVVLNVVLSIIAGLLILVGAGLFVVYTDFHRINYEEIDADPVKPSQNTNSSENSASENKSNDFYFSGELANDPMVLNIMLFGEDTRANATTAGNSDTMVLFSIDVRHKKLKMLSLLRDTYVSIPGYGENRLNAAYALGGAGLTVKTIQSNYGIKIDKYAVVNFSGFKKIIDTLGGIEVELTSEEVDYINWQSWINAQSEYKNAEGDYKEAVRDQLRYVWLSTVPESEKPINKNNLTFEANGDDEPTAKVRLDGREALWHARNRGEDGICSGDDFTRTQRQRDVIGVIINKLKNSDLATIQSAIYELGPLITTNIKATQMISLASDASKYLKYEMVSESAPNVKEFGSSFTFSSDEHPIYINGYFSSVILVNNWNEYRYQLWKFLYEEQVQYR